MDHHAITFQTEGFPPLPFEPDFDLFFRHVPTVIAVRISTFVTSQRNVDEGLAQAQGSGSFMTIFRLQLVRQDDVHR